MKTTKKYAQTPKDSLNVRTEEQAYYGPVRNAERLRKMVTGKSKTLSLRITPDLLALLDETLKNDNEFSSRNELIEVLLLRYLESKGMI